VPCRARDVRPLLLRRRASRPQLKRNPLGSHRVLVMIALLLGGLAVGLAQPFQAPIGVEDLAIGRFTWNGDTAAARRALGAPTSIRTYDTRIDDEDLHLTEWHYRGLLLTFAPSGHLRQARITSPRWRSRRGLRVGDTNQRVRVLYGAPWQESDGSLHYHLAGDPRTRLGLFTLSRGDRVTTIVIGVIVNGD